MSSGLLLSHLPIKQPQGAWRPQLAQPIQWHGAYPGEDWQMNFTQMPVSQGYKYLLVMIDGEGNDNPLLDSLLMSQAMEENKRKLNTPVCPWELWDTYSGLQMSVILMNTPKIKFLRIRFLRIALKSQHSLAGVVLQNRQELDLLISEQGGTWAILNETCCFWVNTSS